MGADGKVLMARLASVPVPSGKNDLIKELAIDKEHFFFHFHSCNFMVLDRTCHFSTFLLRIALSP